MRLFAAKIAARRCLVHRTAAAVIHAADGLATTGSGGGGAIAVGGKSGQLLLKPSGVTFWTLDALSTKNDGFKFVSAFGAQVLENRHTRSRTTLRPP
jgi:hypothetical protein